MNTSPAEQYRLALAAAANVPAIAAMQQHAYGRNAVSVELLQAWHTVNPLGFNVVVDGDGNIVGHMNMLPLRPAPLAAFVVGTIAERDWTAADLYRPEEREDVTALYLESFLLDLPPHRPRKPAVRTMLLGLPVIAAKLARPERLRNVCAMAATAAGQRLLGRLGFVVDVPAKHRADGHDLYRVGFAELMDRIHAECHGLA